MSPAGLRRVMSRPKETGVDSCQSGGGGRGEEEEEEEGGEGGGGGGEMR